jgi:hypothetical protein
MSESDSWMYSRIAELEARLELANKALWIAQQRIQELESDTHTYDTYDDYVQRIQK